jgi:Ca-activated chloride channel homolog
MWKMSWFIPVLFLVSTLSAQSLPPAMFVDGERGLKSLGISKVETNVLIFGGLAETTVTMIFQNDLSRVMEGDLFFPLPEGSTISGYALDINGRMVDGVSVPKDRGRQVFNDIISIRRDPGLMEWIDGNTFKTRVFPIPAHGSRTVRVTYDSELADEKDGMIYRLPLGFKRSLPEFLLRVEVIQQARQPQVTAGGIRDFAFVESRGDFVAETDLRNATLREDLAILLPGKPEPRTIIERAEEGGAYFAIYDLPPVSQEKWQKGAPEHVVIYWDASGSRGALNHDREIGVLTKYFAAQLQVGRQPIRVDIIPFNIFLLPKRKITLTERNLEQLSAELKKIQYDGGTQISALTLSSDADPPDFYMLFTDGNANIGKLTAPVFNAPVYVFSNSPDANNLFLGHLAKPRGGCYFNLEEAVDVKILAAMGQSQYSCLSVSVDGGEAIDLYPKLPQPVNGCFILIGKLESPQAKVTLRYGIEGQVLHESTFRVDLSEAAEGNMVRSFWAQKILAELMVFQKRNRQAIMDLGRNFNVVTPYTSLIVLESISQYLQYEIEPPKTQPKLRTEYLSQIKSRATEEKKIQAEHIEELVKTWQQHVGWWEKKYDYASDFKYHPEKIAISRQINRSPRIAASSIGPSSTKSMGSMSMGGMGMGGMGMGGMSGTSISRSEPSGVTTKSMGGSAGGGGQTVASHPSSEPAPAKSPVAPALRLSPYDMEPMVLLKASDQSAATWNKYDSARKEERLAIYLKRRPKYANSPGFFLDNAEFFRLNGESETALQIISNLAELDSANPALMRILGQELSLLNYLDLAVLTFEEVLRLRPDEPQSYRDLAIALEQRAQEKEHPSLGWTETNASQGPATTANSKSIKDDYARAINLMCQIINKRWNRNYQDMDLISLEDVNAIIPAAKKAGVQKFPLDNRLIKLLDEDFRVVLTWNVDHVFGGLRITEPSGEQANHNHPDTTIGGLIFGRVSNGSGLEEYEIRKAMQGMFKMEITPSWSIPPKNIVPTVLRVDVFTNFGRPNQTHKLEIFKLSGSSQQTKTIGKVKF